MNCYLTTEKAFMILTFIIGLTLGLSLGIDRK